MAENKDITPRLEFDFSPIEMSLNYGTQSSFNASTSSNINNSTTTITTDITSSITSINSNTTTKTEILKQTPVSAITTLSSGSSYQTVLDYSGQGIIVECIAAFAGTGYNNGIKITIDGTLYAESTDTGTSTTRQWTLGIARPNVVLTPYTFYNNTVGDPLIPLIIPFKTSVKIEAYCSGTSRLVNYLIGKNI